MQIDSRESIHPIFWAVGIAVALVCSAGIASFIGWVPSPGESGPTCPECGTIKAVQVINAAVTPTHSALSSAALSAIGLATGAATSSRPWVGA